MPVIRVDPFSLGLVLTGLFYLVAGAYLLSIRGKSKATWALTAYCLFVVIQMSSVAFGFWTSDIVALNQEFFSSAVGKIYLLSVQMAGVALVQVAYRFIESPWEREPFVALVSSVLIALAVTTWSLTIVSTIIVIVPYFVTTVFTSWALVVTLRKAFRNRKDARLRRAYIALGVFLAVASGVYLIQNLWAIASGYRQVQVEIIFLVLIFANALALLIVYIQHAPEPTTFHVKLVGYVFVLQLIVFGAILRVLYAEDNLRTDFAPLTTPTSISFVPDSSGAYSVTATPIVGIAVDDIPVGIDVGLEGDDEVVRYDLPFTFPFGDRMVDVVWLSSNGAIQTEPGEALSFTGPMSQFGQHPMIAAYFADLSPGLSGGYVATTSSPDSLTITWFKVRPYLLYNPVTVQATLYRDGRITVNHLSIPSGLVYGAVGVLPFAARRTTMASSVEDLATAVPSRTPVAYIDRRSEYKSFVHARLMPFVWIMLASIVGLLILSPLFFHASLVAPLRRVLKGVRSVNDGDLDAEVTVGVRDEIGYLAQNFNHMTQSLRRYAGEMEGLVADRTSELEASLETIKNAQAQLIQQEKLASLGQMTAGIAHEIKNPLNFVNNFAELNDELFAEFEEAVAKGEPVDELIADLRSNTHQISENGKRADGIVRSMLQHAHTGERTVARIDINALVDEYVTLSFHSAKSRIPDFNVKLIRSLSPSAGEAEIAASDISRVLINLIGNAFDAIKEHGGTTVTVSTTGSEDWVEIRVSDDGPGMSESIQQRIFEPFFTTKPTGSGTGLGLSLSYDIVTAGHGGTMTVESTEGEGATFVVTLPRKLA